MNPSTTPHPVRRLLSAVAAAMFLLGATLILGGPAQAHADHHITIKNYMFMPMSLTIEQGATVTWTNEDQAGHNVVVTSGPASFSSPMLATGKSWSHTFTVAGPYSYICGVHPDMKATITVTAPVSAAVTTSAPARALAAARVVSTTRGKTGTKPAAAVPAAPSATTQIISAPQSSATLQPLLLVVGASVAAVVFCLLLMASRPIAVASTGPSSSPDDPEPTIVVPKHLDDA